MGVNIYINIDIYVYICLHYFKNLFLLKKKKNVLYTIIEIFQVLTGHIELNDLTVCIIYI